MKKYALHVLTALRFQMSICLVFLRARVAQKCTKFTMQIHAQFLLAIEAEFVFVLLLLLLVFLLLPLRRGRGGEHGLVYRLENEAVSRTNRVPETNILRRLLFLFLLLLLQSRCRHRRCRSDSLARARSKGSFLRICARKRKERERERERESAND